MPEDAICKLGSLQVNVFVPEDGLILLRAAGTVHLMVVVQRFYV